MKTGITDDRLVKMRRPRVIKILALLLSIMPVLTLSAQAPAPILEPARTSTPPNYLIQPNDLLTIFVWKEPTLSGKVLVLPDGRISFGLIQDMSAAGLNPGELAKKIVEHLKQYMKEDIPTVIVSVEAIQSYKVYVIGKVVKSGEIMAVQPINVLQALSLAGGFSDLAKPSEIVVFRGTGESTVPYKFNFSELPGGKNYSQNMFLKSGDVVYVP